MSCDFEKLDAVMQMQMKHKDEMKTLKQQQQTLESEAIEWLLQNNIQFVDQSQRGIGPYWALAKSRSEPSFNKDSLTVFFSQLLGMINNELQQKGNLNNLTPDTCTALASNFNKARQKRRIKLVRLTQSTQCSNTNELKQWVLQGDT
jgi:hypothetical protein